MTTETTPKPRTESDVRADIERVRKADVLDFERLLALTKEMDSIHQAAAKLEAERIAQARVAANAAAVGDLKAAFASKVDNIRKMGPVLRLTIDATGEDVLYTAVYGSAASTRTSAGASGAPRMAGKVGATYGRSLDSVFQEFATPEERAAYDALDPNAKRLDSLQYSAKRKVLERAINEGKIHPVG